jgi:hypothetical protein
MKVCVCGSEVRTDTERAYKDPYHVCVPGFLEDSVASHEDAVCAYRFEACGACRWVIGIDLSEKASYKIPA